MQDVMALEQGSDFDLVCCSLCDHHLAEHEEQCDRECGQNTMLNFVIHSFDGLYGMSTRHGTVILTWASASLSFTLAAGRNGI